MKKRNFLLFTVFAVLMAASRIWPVDFCGFNEWGAYLFLTPALYFLSKAFRFDSVSSKNAVGFALGAAISILLSYNTERDSKIVVFKFIALLLGFMVVYILHRCKNK